MKKILGSVLSFVFLFAFAAAAHAAGDLTISSVTVPAGNMNQGSNNNIVYIAKLDVTNQAVQLTNVQFTLDGTYGISDLASVNVWFSNTPDLSGAFNAGTAAANFAGPHLFNISSSFNINAGTTIYMVIAANINAGATDNHTVSINGAANPLVITATVPPNIINSQTNAAGVQTIQAVDLTLSTVTRTAGDINQGTNNNIIYIARLDAVTEPVSISNVLFTLGGSYDNDDLGNIRVWYSNTPDLSGAFNAGTAAGSFAAPHAFNIIAPFSLNVNATIYIVITADINPGATDNNTVSINGAVNPLTITTTTVPNIINNQTNAAGVQTIQAADVSVGTVTMSGVSLNPGTNSNIIYAAKIDVATGPLTISNVLFNLSGTYDNDDLGTINVWYSNTPDLSGAFNAGTAPANFAGPHAFNISAPFTVPAGHTIYLLITANINAGATDNHTLFIDGATDPLTFTATNTPNITNNQTNVAGVQTIQTADIILSSVTLPASNIVPGTNNNIVYVVKMALGAQPVTVNGAQLNLAGTYDNDDLGAVNMHFSNVAPNLGGSFVLASSPATVSGPHTFPLAGTITLPGGTTGYFIFTVNVNSGATINNTVSVDGATDPVVFSYSTTPNVTNNQSNAAGVFYFNPVTLPLTLTSFTGQPSPGGSQVQLDWITSSEVNTQEFEIQWSKDGSPFQAVGTIAAQGNSQSDKPYSFTHLTPASGLNSYRLKMIDIDGKFTFSRIVSVRLADWKHSVTIAPNPVGSQLRLVLGNTDPVKMLRIFDVGGKLIWQSSAIANTGTITIPFGAYVNGSYTIEVTLPHSVERLPFIKTGN